LLVASCWVLLAKLNPDPENKTGGAEEFRVTLVLANGEERTITARADEHIWDAAARAGIKLPALCHQGWCLTCAAKIEGHGETDQADSLAYFAEDRAAGYALLCTGKARSELRLRTRCAEDMRRHRLEHGLPSPYSSSR
jgi:ferredoxin